MLLLTLLAIVFTGFVVGVFVYAVKYAAEGREDETGFQYVVASNSSASQASGEAHARVARG
jgi:hypothetical protein